MYSHEDITYSLAPMTPSLQGERRSEEKLRLRELAEVDMEEFVVVVFLLLLSFLLLLLSLLAEFLLLVQVPCIALAMFVPLLCFRCDHAVDLAFALAFLCHALPSFALSYFAFMWP